MFQIPARTRATKYLGSNVFGEGRRLGEDGHGSALCQRRSEGCGHRCGMRNRCEMIEMAEFWARIAAGYCGHIAVAPLLPQSEPMMHHLSPAAAGMLLGLPW